MQKPWTWLIVLFGLNLFLVVAGNLGIFAALAEVIEGEVCYKVARDESTADKRTEAGIEDEGAGERQIRLKTRKAFLVCDRALIDLEVLRSLQPEVTPGAGLGAGQAGGGAFDGTSAAPATGPGSGTGTGGGGGGGGGGSSGSSGATTDDDAQYSLARPGEENAQGPDSPNNEVSGTAGLFEEASCSVPEPSGCFAPTSNGMVGPTDAKTLCLAADTTTCPSDSRTGKCAIVGPGTYTYKFVHVLDGGTLFFKDDDPDGMKTEFLASSILVEQGGSVEAGTAACPFGSNNGQLSIGLWGAAATNSGQVPPGAPIACLSNNGNCYPAGYESGHYCTVSGSFDPCSATEKPAIGNNALFEGYNPLPNDGGAMFGYKAFAVSYGGNVQLFGKKGVKTNAQTPPNTCPTPANQFNVQDWADLTDSSWARLSGAFMNSTQLRLDRQVDWVGGDPGKGDKIVVGTTDWHASHSELAEIMKNDPVNLTVCAGGPNAGSQCTTSPPGQCPSSTCSATKQVSQLTLTGALDYKHRGELLPVPSDLGNATMNPNTQVDLRAAVGLLSRDIAIISKGQTAADDFPNPSPGCTTDNPGCYFGGHFIVRQGFKNVQIRGVEFRQLGQGANMGHYPVHFHLAKSTAYTSPLIEDNSIWDSMTRFVVLHATHDVPVSRNVGYLSMGHGYYLEDGSEINNLLCQNLAVSARGSLKEYFTAQQAENPNKPTARYIPPILDGSQTPGTCKDGANKGMSCLMDSQCPGSTCSSEKNIHGSDSYVPVPFWAMNAYNEFVGNKAAGVHGFGSCYWLLGSGVSGPSSTRLHWTEGSDTPQDYANFNVAGTQQAPLKRFRNNACTTAAYALQTTLDVEPTSEANARYQAATSPYPPLTPEMRPLISGNFTPVSFGPTFADKDPQTSDMVAAVASESQCDANGSALTMPNDVFDNVLSNITFNANGEGALKVEGFSSPQNDGNLTAFNQKGTGGGKICVKDMLANEAAGPQVILAPQEIVATEPACSQGVTSGNEKLFATNAQHCVTTVIDRFTTSFNWSEVNFGSVWLRPQFYLFLNSSITDQLTGGLGFVSGGGWQQAPPGYFTITKNSVFSGTSQSTGPGQPSWAGPTGPILTKATATANCASGLCLFPEDGTALFMGGLNPKRLITIYDGPSYSQGSIFLKTGTIRDTPTVPRQPVIPGCLATQQGAGDDTVLACGIYQSTVQPSAAGIAGGAGRMFVEDAGIGWKQTNGFYYPPAFAYAYTGFEKYDRDDDPVCFSLVRNANPPPEFVPEPRPQICRHNVLDQYVTYAQGSVEQPNDPVKTAVLGTVGNALGIKITPIDFGTILNDLDGTLTGWVPQDAGTRTSSLSRNEFFDAPSQDAECNSFGTQTTPFEMVTTVVSKLKGNYDLSTNYVDSKPWGGAGEPELPFPAVAIYRQQRVGGESAEPCKAVCGEGEQNEEWACDRATFMAGGQTGGAPYLTMNNGVYYIDTGSKSTSTAPQTLDCVAGAWGVCSNDGNIRCLDDSACGAGTCDSQWFLPEFNAGDTYVVYNLFATEETNVHYQVYVGGDLNTSIPGQWVRVKPHVSDPSGTGNDIEVVPCTNCGGMKATPNHVPGVLDLTFDYAGMTADFDFVQRSENEKCLPRDICEIPTGKPGECVVASTFKTAEPDLEETVDEICQFWVRATAGTTDFETTRPDGTKIQTPTSFADCPEGGCVGYAFTLPAGFVPKPYGVVGEPAAMDADKTACFDPAIFNKPMENVDTDACPDPKGPTATDFCVATIGG